MRFYANGLKLIVVASLTTTLLTGCLGLGASVNDPVVVLPEFPVAGPCVIPAIRNADKALIRSECKKDVTKWLVNLSKLCQKLDKDC